MRLALQIFRKDIERLWRVVLLTMALLALFAHQDTTRTIAPLPGFAPAANDGWLNLALPFAWSLLIALVIIEDPLAGDRQFWVSLPCGWQPLLAAKTAFIAAFIQLPYLLATAAILLAKGFNPLEHIPHLFWKQLVLLALILPAAAVSTIVKNTAHFLLVAITVAGGVVIMSNRFNFGFGLDTSWDVRWNLTLLVLGVGALTIAILQFVRRYTLHSRAIGVATAIAAFSLYTWLPRGASAAIGAAVAPAHVAPITLALGSRVPSSSDQRFYSNFRQTAFLIPVLFSSPVANSRLDQISFEMITATGQRYEAQWPRSSNNVRSQRITAGLDMYTENVPLFQWLEVGNPQISKRLLSGPVTIKGRILARFYQAGQQTALRPAGRTEVPGLGYCVISADDFECDSPELTAGQMLMNGEFLLRDRIAMRISYYPQDPWLSPLHEAMSRFMAGTAAPTIAPSIALGSAVIDYTFADVDLNRFLLPEVRR